jgi:hypothetical protein
MRRTASIAILTASILTGVLTAQPACAVDRASAAAITRALDYLHACQRSDGGFAEKGAVSSEQLTAWAIVAISSVGEDPASWAKGTATPLTYLARTPSRWTATTDYARTVLAAVAAGQDARHFAGVDLVDKIQADRHTDGSNGDRLGPFVNSHVWALLALRAAGEPVTDAEIRWLTRRQNADGGWSWAPGMASDSNDTAAAIQALVAAGQSPQSAPVQRAVDYLHTRQLGDGGFSYAGSAGDANSAAWAAQALVAAGQSPVSSRWRKGHNDPLSFLRALQGADGAIRYSASQSTNPLLVTVQAIPALAGKPFPVARAARPARPAAAAPTVRILWPRPGTVVAWPIGAAVKLQVTDNPGGTGVLASGMRVTVDGRSTSLRLSKGVAIVDTGILGAGSHSLSVRATDRAGNVAYPPTWRFSVSSAGGAATSAGGSGAATATASGVGTLAIAGLGASPATGTATAGGDQAGAATTAAPADREGLATSPAAGGAPQTGGAVTRLWTIAGVAGALLAVACLAGAAVGIVMLRRLPPP